MKKHSRLLLLTLSMIFVNSFCIGSSFASNYSVKNRKANSTAPPYIIDLSSPIITNTYYVQNNQPFSVQIINMAPSLRYTINGDIEINAQDVLPPLPVENSHLKKLSSADSANKAKCSAMYTSLSGATSEIDFALLMTQAKALKTLSNCSAYDDFLKISTFTDGLHTLNNETYTLTITNNASPKKTWTVTFKTQETGKFLTTYGMSYVPYLFVKPHTYYAQQWPQATYPPPTPAATSTPQYYKILQGSSEAVSEFVPSIFFHWLSRTSSAWSASWTGGLGLGLNGVQNAISPTVFGGASFIYHDNIGISFGLAGHTLNRLKGVYSPGQYITTNLQPSDLNEQVIRFNPFISITFRFGSKPFSTQSTTAASIAPNPPE